MTLSSSSELGKRIARNTVWRRQLELFPPRPSLGPKRAIGRENPGWLRVHHSPKLGRAISCESQTEVDFYRALDETWSIAHYCEQPLWVRYRYKGQFSTYHPDVHMSLMDGRRVLAEIKSPRDLGDFTNFKKWTALLRFAHPIGYGVFIGDCRSSFAEALKRRLPPDLLVALSMFARSKSGATDAHMEILRARFQFDDDDLAAAVLQCGLYMTRRPFVLRAPAAREETLIRELRTAFANFGTMTPLVDPADSTVRGVSEAALGVAARGRPRWFRESGWSYRALGTVDCPRCRDSLHVLGKPWVNPRQRSVTAKAIVCVACATASLTRDFDQGIQKRLRAAC